MRKKWVLFVGIALLLIGIFLKILMELTPWSTIIIITGVCFKIYYILYKIISGEYKPGFEMILLLIGLTIYCIGIYIKSHGRPFNALFLMVPGISMKIAFVFFFIKKAK